jgi:DNA-directed RNA polymerase II subunit RPB2
MKHLTPELSLKKRKTYMSKVYVDLYCKQYKKTGPEHFHQHSIKIYKQVQLFEIPCMRYTSICHEHTSLNKLIHSFGTFIINGYEKCLISQESMKINFPYISKKNGSYICEIRSKHSKKIRSSSTVYLTLTSKGILHAKLPFLEYKIPITLMFKLFDIRDIDIMIELISGTYTQVKHKTFVHTILKNNDVPHIHEYKEIIDWLDNKFTRKKNKKYIDHIIQNEFLPHCGSKVQKMFFLGLSLRKLINTCLNIIPVDHIDDYTNKRITCTGTLLALLTRQLIRKQIRNCQLHVNKILERNQSQYFELYLVEHFDWKRVTHGLQYAINTGNWGIQKGTGNQTGISQVINSTNMLSILSHMRQVNTPLNRDGKMSNRRQLELSHLGILCCAETPEGKSVGFLSNFAFFTKLRHRCTSTYIKDILKRYMNVIPVRHVETKLFSKFMVFVKGIPFGFTDNAIALVRIYKFCRKRYLVPMTSNIRYHKETNCIYIDLDENDCIRPIINASKLNLLIFVVQTYKHYMHFLWNRLLIEGCIEYVNKNEEHMYTIASSLEQFQSCPANYTHLEIHASLTLFGTSAGCIPFSNHNQAPRNIYQSAMCKQAISCTRMDFAYNYENKAFVLNYPQRALVQTWTDQLTGNAKKPSGQALITAVQVLTGYNQEDGVIINQDAIDRGLFSTSIYTSYKSTEKNHGTDVERFGKIPESAIGKKFGNYNKLGPTGFVPVGTKIEKNDVLIGKFITYTQTEKINSEYKQTRIIKDKSILLQKEDEAYVSHVLQTKTNENLNSISLRTCSLRTCEVGDKVSSRHGQKGIVGMTMKSVDMPFTQDGTVVDLVMNCHSFPSRMTIGHLKETLIGKAAALEGKIADGTAFAERNEQEIQQILHNNGFSGFGKETLYCGKTGKKLKNRVFIGITYYQRLKHMVKEKIHARTTGPCQTATRQPVEGRAKNGGLRVGEMERDAIISHGCSEVLRDRLCVNSDLFETVVCKKCGFLSEPAIPEKNKKILDILHQRPYCRFCQSHDHVVKVEIPYAMKTLWQELLACHIHLKLKF